MNKFPKDFLWGASTSAYQFEGHINEGGKVPSIMDTFDKSSNYPKNITGFKDASGHYAYWKEDVKLMSEMGFKSYRFSISWPRIIKNKLGDVNLEGIKFYKNILQELKKYQIEPIVTIFHFDTPLFVEEDGGVESKKFIEHFTHYSKVLFENFGSEIKYWLTINELNVMVMVSQIIGTSGSKAANEWQVMHNLNVAQAATIDMCHEMLPEAKIGPAPNIGSVYPASSKPEDYTAKLNVDLMRNWVYLDIVCKGQYSKTFLRFLEKQNKQIEITDEEIKLLKKSKPDFLAFNYYSTSTIEMPLKKKKNENQDQQSGFSMEGFASSVQNSNLEKTEYGWTVDPIGFRNTFREVYERYNIPLMITENGIGQKEELSDNNEIHDQYRIDYYKKHIEQMALAIDDGVEIIGYMPWSAIDLVSTHEGISKRYGFVYVNRDEFDLKDLKRYKKDSFFWYQKVIKSNGEEL